MTAEKGVAKVTSAGKEKAVGSEKVDAKNSVSMQRAIDRVSKERKVKQSQTSTVKSASPKRAAVQTKAPSGVKKTASKTRSSSASRTSSSAPSTRPTSSSSKSKSSVAKKSAASRASSTSSKESPGKRRSKLATVKETGDTVKAVNKATAENDSSKLKAAKIVEKKETSELKAEKKVEKKEIIRNRVTAELKATKIAEKKDTITNTTHTKEEVESDAPVSLKVTEETVQTDIEEDPADDTTEVDCEKDTLPDIDTNELKKLSKTVENVETASNSDDKEEEGRDARDITRKMIADILRTGDDELSFEFEGYDVPVSYSPAVDYDMAIMAIESSPFHQWQAKMSNAIGTKRLEIRHVEIHTVDFVDEVVDMIKMNTQCVLVDDEMGTEEDIASGVCYLRDNYVALLLELVCIEDASSWSILVDNPRVPIGAVSALELPVGKVDEEEERLFGYEIEEIEEAFGLELNMNRLIDLSEEAYEYNPIRNEGMCPCPGQSGEQVKIMYLKKQISKDHLLMMRSKFSERREEGALISLRVVPLADIWKVSADMKVMCALFLLEKANESGYESDEISVSVRGRRLVSSMLSNVARPLTASSSTRCTEM